MDVEAIASLGERLRAAVGTTVVGQAAAVDLLLVCLMCRGHVILEGMPGLAKTLLVRSFAAALSLDFGRIQFTPDLMPGDVLGTNMFDFRTSRFVLTKGPVFTELLLADEINRTPPKTQSALLQAMQERVVTIDGVDYSLGPGFMVIATQNPIEQEGTYPLPEAQLDRFLFKHVLGYPTEEEERAIVGRHGHRTEMPRVEEFGLAPVAGRELLDAVWTTVEGIRLAPEVADYVVAVVRGTRVHPSLQFGASPRAANMLAAAARARAALGGRDYVIPDDVKALAAPTLRHRILMAPVAEIEGLSPDGVIEQVLEWTEAPR